MDVLHIEQLLYCRRHFLCGLELHEIPDRRAMATDTYQSFSDTTLCAYNASPCIQRYLVRSYPWQQNSRTLWLHTTHQTTALLPTMQCFIRTNLASYATRCSVFSIKHVYANIKITKRYQRISLRICCQAAKKEHKLEVKVSVQISYR